MRLGFGTWPLGGTSYGPLPRDRGLATVAEAVRLGIRFFDTAPIYGNGTAEELLGEALAAVTDGVIASKVGYVSETSSEQRFDEPFIRRSLEGSLARLRRPMLDVCLLHSPPRDVLSSGAVQHSMRVLRDSGIARAVGVSLRSIDDFEIAAGWDDCEYIEVVFNLADQRLLDAALDRVATERGVRIIARVPLSFGILTGKFAGGVPHFGEHDQRRRWPADQTQRWTDAAERFRFLETPRGSLVVAALAFCLAVPAVSYVIPGMKSPEQVRENVSAIEPAFQLTASELARAREIWAAELIGVPPR